MHWILWTLRWVRYHLTPEGNDALDRYLAFVREDGDTLNDWLTHLPVFFRGIVYAIGQAIIAFGG